MIDQFGFFFDTYVCYIYLYNCKINSRLILIDSAPPLTGPSSPAADKTEKKKEKDKTSKKERPTTT